MNSSFFSGKRIPVISFAILTIITVCSVLFVIGFLIYAAAPVLMKEGFNFIIGTEWNYDTSTYGIALFLVTTVILTAVTLVIAFPLGLLTAIYLAEWAPASVSNILRPVIELLVGIPSVVYGLFAAHILAPILVLYLKPAAQSLSFIPLFRDPAPMLGEGLILTAFILTIMILPTIVALSQDAMASVPRELREGSYALGTTKWETIKMVIIPVALPGIVTSFVLGLMRAMGETMAVVMILGNIYQVPVSLFDRGYAMTSKIMNDIPFWIALDEPRSALFAIAFVLFLLEFLCVAIIRKFIKQSGNRK